MGYDVACPCGNVLHVSEELAGAYIRCRCGRTLAVPASAETRPGQGRMAEFRRTLHELTPRIWVTPTLIAANALVFVVMVVSGVSFMNPKALDLVRWGANFGPATLQGEWW